MQNLHSEKQEKLNDLEHHMQEAQQVGSWNMPTKQYDPHDLVSLSV